MTRRRRWAVVLAVLAVAAGAPKPVPRIVAVGDLHGDFAAWRAIARGAGLVDEAGDWTGGRTILVQAGDAVDRGPDSLRIVLDLMRLQREAAQAGGRVVALVGNHEAMNMTGDLRYVSAADYAAYADAGSAARRARVFTANRTAIEAGYRRRDPAMTAPAIRAAWLAATPPGAIEHRDAWSPGGRIGRWIVNNPAIVVIDGTLFVHGGLSAAFATLSVEEIDRRVAAALKAADAAPGAIINDPAGPLWYRGLAAQPAAELDGSAPPGARDAPIQAELDTVLRAEGASRMVIAHTPVPTGVPGGVAILYGGRLARIDTGISAAFGGTLGWLEIVDGHFSAHAVPRPVRRQ